MTKLEEAVARAIQVAVDNWTPFEGLSVSETAARAALAVVREAMGEPVAWVKFGAGRRFIRFTPPPVEDFGWRALLAASPLGEEAP